MKTRMCPQGEPMRAADGAPISCLIKDLNACRDSYYICSAVANGDAFCCPDPSKPI